MLEKSEAIIAWIQLIGCCMLTLGVIIAVKLYPDGKSDNHLAEFLLKHVTIQTVIEDDKWSLEYPFEETGIDRYLTSVKGFEKAVENYCTTSFPGGETINCIVTAYRDKIMHYHVSGIPGIDENRAYVSECVDNVLDFKTEVNSFDIPFLYVQTPSSEGIAYYGDKELAGDDLNIAERSYCFISALENEGVDVINMDRDHSDGITFDMSLHWMPQDGLDCARLITEKLGKDYGYNIDPSVYDDANFFDLTEEHTDFKEKVEETYGYDFEVPCPVNGPDIGFVYAEGYPCEGRFGDYMFKPSDSWLLECAYHNVYTIYNSLMYSVHNDSAVCDKKLLVVGDSFSWPVVTYLPLSFRDVTMIHNASFNGSLVSYVKATKPDIVIMLYNDAEFHDIYTEDAFYLK